VREKPDMILLEFCRSCQSIQPLEKTQEGDTAKFWCEMCGYPVELGDAKGEAVVSRRPTILYIDDDGLALSTCNDALTAHGYRVLLAPDGPAGIEIARMERPDLILLDVLMPGMDGIEVCRRLRAEPTLAGVPIILLTALKHPGVAPEGRQAGATLTIRKTYGPESIVSSVDKALGRKPKPRRM
jgi:CheY-like chemotaxis protein